MMKSISCKKALNDLRKEIDKLDDEIIKLLEKRFILTSKLKEFKKIKKDIEREKEILKKIKSKYIQNIYKTIFKNSLKKNKLF